MSVDYMDSLENGLSQGSQMAIFSFKSSAMEGLTGLSSLSLSLSFYFALFCSILRLCCQRFKSVDAEFVQLMRRVAHKPNIMEVWTARFMGCSGKSLRR